MLSGARCMFNRTSYLIASLFVVCNKLAIADPVAVAYASIANSVKDSYQDSSLDGVDSALKQHAYKIELENSSIQFHVKSTIGDVWVTFNDFEGDFSLIDNRDNSDNGSVASIEVNAEKMVTRRGMVRMLLKSSGFLDVSNFPSFRFTGSSLEWFSDTQAILKGKLTIRDVTRQVNFYVELVDSSVDAIGSGPVDLKAMATIKRSEFGITTMLPVVGDQVDLFININASRKDAYMSMK